MKSRTSLDFHSFDSFEEADEFSRAYYAKLSPDERIENALTLMQSAYEAHPRLERI